MATARIGFLWTSTNSALVGRPHNSCKAQNISIWYSLQNTRTLKYKILAKQPPLNLNYKVLVSDEKEFVKLDYLSIGEHCVSFLVETSTSGHNSLSWMTDFGATSHIWHKRVPSTEFGKISSFIITVGDGSDMLVEANGVIIGNTQNGNNVKNTLWRMYWMHQTWSTSLFRY